MTKAQKKMKYIGAAYFILALVKVVFGGLIIWIYAHNFSFRGDTVLGGAILNLSFHIIIDVLCWGLSMKASREPEYAPAILALALFCILGNVCYCINHLVIVGVQNILLVVPWVSLTIYVLTVLTALKIKQERVITKADTITQTTH